MSFADQNHVEDLADTVNAVGTTASTVTTLSATVASQGSSITTLNTRTTDVNTGNVALGGRMTSAEGAITTLNTRTTDASTGNSALGTRVTALEGASSTPVDWLMTATTYKAWTGDPLFTNNQVSIASLYNMWFVKLYVARGGSCTGVKFQVTTAGSGSAGAAEMSLWTPTQGTAALAQTADQQASSWASTGFKTVPWITPVNLTAGTFVLLAVRGRMNSFETSLTSYTNGQDRGTTWSDGQVGYSRCGTVGGQGTLPATLPAQTGTMPNPFWAALY